MKRLKEAKVSSVHPSGPLVRPGGMEPRMHGVGYPGDEDPKLEMRTCVPACTSMTTSWSTWRSSRLPIARRAYLDRLGELHQEAGRVMLRRQSSTAKASLNLGCASPT